MSNARIEGNKLILTIDLNDEPQVSNTEAAKALKEKRDPVARAMGGTGGFVSVGTYKGKAVKVSANVIC